MNQIILFTGEHCSGCKVAKQRFVALKAYYNDRIDFVEYDVETYSDLALRYSVVSIPAMVFIKDGEPIDTVIGVAPIQSLTRVIEEELV